MKRKYTLEIIVDDKSPTTKDDITHPIVLLDGVEQVKVEWERIKNDEVNK